MPSARMEAMRQLCFSLVGGAKKEAWLRAELVSDVWLWRVSLEEYEMNINSEENSGIWTRRF
jgi:hypothetical protein